MAANQDPQKIKDILDSLSEKGKSFQGNWERLRNYGWDIGGILLIALSSMTLIATVFPGLVEGSALLRWANLLSLGVGWGSIFVIGSGIVLGIWMLRQQVGKHFSVVWIRVFALEGAVFSLIAFFTVLGGHSLERARQGLDGGLVGWGLVEAISSVVGLIGTGILVAVGAVIGGIIGLGLTDRVREQLQDLTQIEIQEDQSQMKLDLPPEAELENKSKTSPAKRKRTVPPEFRKQFKVSMGQDQSVNIPPRDQSLPSLDLLVSGKSFKPNQRHC